MAEREGFGGIGRIRDIGDPYDKRRGNPRPQRYFSSREELASFLANEELNRRAAAELAELEVGEDAAGFRKDNDRLIAKQTGWETTQPKEYQVGYSGVDTEEPRTITRNDGKTYANPFYREKGATEVDLGKTRFTQGGVQQKKFAPGIGYNYIKDKQAAIKDTGRELRDEFLALDPVEASRVFSEAAGEQIDPRFAKRIQGYLTALPELNIQQAAYLAAQEQSRVEVPADALARRAALQDAKQKSSAPLLRDRANTAISAEMLARLAASGEIGPDPAIAAVNRAANEGVYQGGRFEGDVLPADQADQLRQYIKQEEENALLTKYMDRANASVGVKPKKSAEIINPYLIPALMAEATEQYGDKFQPATYWDAPKPFGQLRVDPRNVSLELLDPSALLSDRSMETFSQLAYRNDEGELVKPTLGQAINTIKQENRTPLIGIPDNQVEKNAKIKDEYGRTRTVDLFEGRVVKRFGDVAEEPGYGNYRVGNTSAYKDDMYLDINKLLEIETGKQLVTNQSAALARDERMRGVQKLLLRQVMENPSENPTSDLIELLTEGRNIDRVMGSGDKNVGVLATSRAAQEMAWYEQEGYRKTMDQYMERAAIEQGSSTRPQIAEVKTSEYAYDNAPSAPSSTQVTGAQARGDAIQANIPAGNRPTTQSVLSSDVVSEVMGQIPEAARQNVEGGMGMPAGSPRRIAAEDFVRRFISKKRG